MILQNLIKPIVAGVINISTLGRVGILHISLSWQNGKNLVLSKHFLQIEVLHLIVQLLLSTYLLWCTLTLPLVQVWPRFVFNKKMSNFRCLNCAFIAPSEKDLLSHVRRVHQHEARFSIKCYGCSQVHTNLKTHERHVKTCSKPMKQCLDLTSWVVFVLIINPYKIKIKMVYWFCSLHYVASWA